MIRIFFVLLFFLFFNVNNSYSTATVEIPDKTTQSIANNILSGSNNETPLPINDSYYTPFKSFMLSNNVINTIQKALMLHNNRGKIDINKNEENLENSGEIATFNEEMKNIYLKAIMYISNNNWNVWINDVKISNTNNLKGDNEYIIKKININEAIINLNVSKTKWNYLNSSGAISNGEFSIDEEKNKVNYTIKLHPNQTFVFSKNTVIDGKYKGEAEKLMDSIDNNKELDLFLSEEFNFEELQ